MNRDLAPSPLRAATVATLALLGGCSWFGSASPSGDSIDYRSTVKQSAQLEVPPDLTQLSREGRYTPRSGVVSANELATQAAARPGTATVAPLAPASTAAAVAPLSSGDVRLAREGQTRWLVSSRTPEQLWPEVEAFWRDLGFTLTTSNAQTGVIETSWAENRALLPDDIIRRTLGNVLSSIYSTGLRDRFHTRIERGTDGTEIYVTHRGTEEVLVGTLRDQTVWQPRPSDPQLEAEMLSRLMLRLGGKSEQAVAVKADAPKAPPSGPRELVLPARAEMEIAEPFDRAWRQVGLALDRGGFTIEDRDRSAGLYFVRYADPRQADKEEPSFFAKWFGKAADSGLLRYRITLKAAGAKTTVSVLDSKGTADNSENARRIVGRLQEEFKR